MTAEADTTIRNFNKSQATLDDVDLYAYFRLLIEKPGAGRQSLILDTETPSLLSQIAEYVGVADFEVVDRPSSVEEAESYYISLFEVGLPAPPCPLNESPYNRTAPPTKVIHENVLFFCAFGLEMKAENTELPDHISNQLEFLSYLTRLQEQSMDAESTASILAAKRDFIDRHVLSWLPALRDKLKELDEHLYAPVFELLEAYVRQDMEKLRSVSV